MTKNKVGRPTLYKEEYIDEIDRYLEDCVDYEEEFHKTRGQTSDSYERILKVKLPTVEGFCMRINTIPRTVYEWRDVHPEFSQALEKINLAQKKVLLEKGTSGEYNSTIAKLILSSNHGMKEKTDITSNDKEIQPILVKFLDVEKKV